MSSTQPTGGVTLTEWRVVSNQSLFPPLSLKKKLPTNARMWYLVCSLACDPRTLAAMRNADVECGRCPEVVRLCRGGPHTWETVYALKDIFEHDPDVSRLLSWNATQLESRMRRERHLVARAQSRKDLDFTGHVGRRAAQWWRSGGPFSTLTTRG